MEGIGQGELRLSGIPCVESPFYLWINQGFNRHGQMKVGVWVSEEAENVLSTGMPVILEHTKEDAAPIFYGIVKRSTAGKEKGQSCLFIEVETASSLLDQKKKKPFFPEAGAQLSGTGGRSFRTISGLSCVEKRSRRRTGVWIFIPV